MLYVCKMENLQNPTNEIRSKIFEQLYIFIQVYIPVTVMSLKRAEYVCMDPNGKFGEIK